jgi:hypothetical protein
MNKPYFHNKKQADENKKNIYQDKSISTKKVVDINMLLNRVKINKKNDTRSKIINFSLIILTLIFVTLFINFLK